MRLRDAITSLQLGRKKQVEVRKLHTVWDEQAEDGPDFVPLAEYPRPQFRREDWKCLNGWWEYGFRQTGESMGEADGKILVPYSPETDRSGVGHVLMPGEELWYRKSIEGLQIPDGKRVLLHFGAVDERCVVWWNGNRVGAHRNGYLSFSFDVTQFVSPGTNILEVRVRDDTDKGTACRGKQTLQPAGMYYHAQSGIWQTVWLEFVPDNYLGNLRITPLPDEKAVELTLRFAGGGKNPDADEKADEGAGGETCGKADEEAVGKTCGKADEGADGETCGKADEGAVGETCGKAVEEAVGETCGKAGVKADPECKEKRLTEPRKVKIIVFPPLAREEKPGEAGAGKTEPGYAAPNETSALPSENAEGTQFRAKTADREENAERLQNCDTSALPSENVEGTQFRAKTADTAENAADPFLEDRTGKSYVFSYKRGMKVRIPIPEPQLWSPENPVLYTLRIEAGEDVVDSYFAMRSFGVGKDEAGRPRLLLNGAPYLFHGVLDQGYWPRSLMTPPADEAFVHDITQMKLLGFNMLRKHVKIEPARWYWHCDRIGMVVWQDMVNGGSPVNKMLDTYLPTIFPPIGIHLRDNHYSLLSREDAAARKRFEADLRRMIRQLYNCPCIGLWVPFNEGWGQFDSLRITDEIKKEDPTRPVDHASGWFDQGGGDVRSVHNYFRALEVEPDPRPFVLSEYGGVDCLVPGHTMCEEVYGYRQVQEDDFRKSFQELMDQIYRLEKDGLSGAVYTQVSDIEEETNGLLTYDRKVTKYNL